MYAYAAAIIAGALLAGRTKPKTRAVKRDALGARTGIAYKIEEFPEPGFLVVRAPKHGSVGVFERRGQGGFDFLRGKGNPQEIALMKADFSPGSKKDEDTK